MDGHPIRRHIIELLQLLSSEQQQLEYEENVPIAYVPDELRCMWFDDLYHPRLIAMCFTPSEGAALARFNAVYDVEKHNLPESPESIRVWLADPTWQKIMTAASETLKQLNQV